MKDHETKIAEASLAIDAIQLRPQNPFTWASGYRMPIYNDNRRLLSSYHYRMLVTKAFLEYMRENNISYDYVAGTATAGIAPAASLAQALNVPLIIMQDEKAYVFENDILDQKLDQKKKEVEQNKTQNEYDAIASTCPFSIPFGVKAANRLQLPFMYVRQKKKAYGMGRQIEGLPKKEKQVLLLDYYQGETYHENAKSALEESGVTVSQVISKQLSTLQPQNIEGKKVIVVEDLISTGGSSAKAVQEVRDAGGLVTHCFSIFTYDLLQAQNAFEGLVEPVEVKSLLHYDQLLEIAKQKDILTQEQLQLLQSWRIDPFNWGEQNGFPKVEK